MRAIVGADITIRKCTPAMAKYFVDKLTFGNPDYYKRLNAGRWVGNTPERIRLYVRDGDCLIIPFGMLPDVFKLHEQFENIENITEASKTVCFKSNIKLYGYQQEALKAALMKRQGVIVAPCGAGKTMIGLQLAAEIGQKTLWLTHTQDLLNQSKNRAEEMFDLQKGDVGTITAGKVDIGKLITFATVQTACKIDLERYKHTWGCVIVDECHRVSGTPTQVTMFSKVLSNLAARYKYGLTATPKRSDGLTQCMFSLLGEKVAEIDKSQVATTCPVMIRFVETEYKPDYDVITNPDGTINYSEYITNVSQDCERNKLIADTVKVLNGTVLVLTDRVEHERSLAEALASGTNATVARKLSYAKKSERKEMLDGLRRKEYKVMIATYALAKEGLDIPSLDNIVFATPQKNESTVVQSVGRVARSATGKTHGTVVDIVDDCVLFDRMATQRKRIYKRNGWL